jgi:hypothetical protein
MGGSGEASGAVSTIAAMVTPALFILAASSLVSSALVRMARVSDRARVLTVAAREGGHERLGATPAQLREWLKLHESRARHAERAIAALYLAVVFFVATCLGIALERILGALPVLAAARAGRARSVALVLRRRLDGVRVALERPADRGGDRGRASPPR